MKSIVLFTCPVSIAPTYEHILKRMGPDWDQGEIYIHSLASTTFGFLLWHEFWSHLLLQPESGTSQQILLGDLIQLLVLILADGRLLEVRQSWWKHVLKAGPFQVTPAPWFWTCPLFLGPLWWELLKPCNPATMNQAAVCAFWATMRKNSETVHQVISVMDFLHSDVKGTIPPS